MLIKGSVILTFLMLSAQLALAAWPPKNVLCEKARLAEFTISNVDICDGVSIQQPKYLEALRDLTEINLSAARLMDISLTQLFPEGIAIEIFTGFSGLNGSAKSSNNRITLTNYPNPYKLINKGVYSHELGHALSFSQNSSVPAALRATHRSPLLGETVADTIAFALVGEETSHEMNLPLCFSAKRISFNQTYNTHTGFFDRYYNLHLLAACCEEYAETNADTKKICENYFLNEGGEAIIVPPYNESRFSFLDKVSFEEHRIGIPLNSFLLTLGHQVGKNLFKEFIQSYSSLDSTMYKCQFEKSIDEKQSIKAEGWSLKNQLQVIRSNLSMEDKIRYDVLWTQLGIQAAIIIDDAEISSRALIQAQKNYIKVIRNNLSQFRDYRTCADDFENIELFGAPAEVCKIKCLKINPYKI